MIGEPTAFGTRSIASWFRYFLLSLNMAFYPHTAPAILSLALLASCTVGPDYEKPLTNSLPAAYRWSAEKNGRVAASRDEWWKIFRSSDLSRLMVQLHESNHDLKAGLRRIEQARALVQVAHSGRLPGISTSPSATRQRLSDDSRFGGGVYNTFDLPLTVDWELDLFGRIRRTVEASEAETKAAEEDLADLRLSLEAELASRYFEMRALDQEIQIVEGGVESRLQSLQLAKARRELGAVSDLDVSQASAVLALSESDLEGLKSQRAAREAAIAVLAGRPAPAFSLASSPLTGRPPKIPASMPSELARARPDIRVVERLLASENARIGVAEAAFYPSISLSGNFGLQATDIEELFNSGSQFWGISPQIYLPLFQGGRRKALLEQSRSRYEEVLEVYQQTVLEGLAEVETALAAQKYFTGQTAALDRAVSAARKARDVAKDQYEGGTSNYLNVLDAERTALDAERQRATIRGAEYINTVNLIRTLGGCW